MTSDNLGTRYNQNKPELSMVIEAGRALEGCAQVLSFGKVKYSRANWKKGLSLTSTVDSLLRHLTAFMSNEDIDRESQLAHVDHILCNALFLSEMFHTRPDMDDRIKMTELVTIERSDLHNILYSIYQVLPDVEELCYEGNVKESLLEGLQHAIRVLKEALS